MASRIPANKIETKSRDKIRAIIDNNDNALFRELSERDYGIDAIIELFNNGFPTGKIALVQLKSTKDTKFLVLFLFQMQNMLFRVTFLLY